MGANMARRLMTGGHRCVSFDVSAANVESLKNEGGSMCGFSERSCRSFGRAASRLVEDSGEGRWTVQAAMEEAVPANVLTAALYSRFRSRRPDSFSDKMLSAMRKQFGGHVEKK